MSNYPKYENGKVICQECGKAFKVISATHMKNHNMTLEEYRRRYSDCPVSSDKHESWRKYQNTSVFQESDSESNTDQIVDIIEDFKSEPILKPINQIKIPEIELNDNIDIKNIDIRELIQSNDLDPVKEIEQKSFILEYPDPKNQIPHDKKKLLNFLLSYFPNIQNNYMVEIYYKSGHLAESFVTDITEPSSKIIFDFPNAFWHNKDLYHNPFKKQKLIENGWKIYNIKSSCPTINDIMDKLNIITDVS